MTYHNLLIVNRKTARLFHLALVAAVFYPRRMLGLEPGTVRLTPYDPAWPGLFGDEAKRLREALGSNCLRVEHIGSTAVPGLSSKPILDIAVEVLSMANIAVLVDVLAAIGYESKGEFGLPGRQFFAKGLPVTHHVHVVEKGCPYMASWILFREALRGDEQLRREYVACKTRLAAEHPGNRDAYTTGKNPFVESILKARRG